MKCMFCEKEAKTFLTQIEMSELKKICLCEECSKDGELLKKEGLLHILSDSLLQSPTSNQSLPSGESSVNRITCVCGFTSENLSNTGRLGCAVCYETFHIALEGKVKDLHRGESHLGKTLDIPETKRSVEKQLREVNLALHSAVKEENFEEAAILRDQVTSLEQKLTQYDL